MQFNHKQAALPATLRRNAFITFLSAGEKRRRNPSVNCKKPQDVHGSVAGSLELGNVCYNGNLKAQELLVTVEALRCSIVPQDISISYSKQRDYAPLPIFASSLFESSVPSGDLWQLGTCTTLTIQQPDLHSVSSMATPDSIVLLLAGNGYGMKGDHVPNQLSCLDPAKEVPALQITSCKTLRRVSTIDFCTYCCNQSPQQGIAEKVQPPQHRKRI
jgi:hypothetical protein